MNYIIDFALFVKRISPPSKRGLTALAWLRSLLAPLGDVNLSFFDVYYPDVVSRAKRTGQKIILEDTLNKVFNPIGSPKIWIDNTSDDIEPTYFYNEDEGYPPVTMYNESEALPLYLYNESETKSEFDFLVFVPTGVNTSFTNRIISAEVDKYRPVGKRFDIINY